MARMLHNQLGFRIGASDSPPRRCRPGAVASPRCTAGCRHGEVVELVGGGLWRLVGASGRAGGGCTHPSPLTLHFSPLTRHPTPSLAMHGSRGARDASTSYRPDVIAEPPPLHTPTNLASQGQASSLALDLSGRGINGINLYYVAPIVPLPWREDGGSTELLRVSARIFSLAFLRDTLTTCQVWPRPTPTPPILDPFLSPSPTITYCPSSNLNLHYLFLTANPYPSPTCPSLPLPYQPVPTPPLPFRLYSYSTIPSMPFLYTLPSPLYRRLQAGGNQGTGNAFCVRKLAKVKRLGSGGGAWSIGFHARLP
ncbi:hypothetical protein E2C01_046221 [Portunus trituberculatus]|uniref:Uncharacterized protein n=1 Tax=Portunus trituberculatus TaxID=210409 RepID=A0A5B7G525_PORTR|nr:hypothetical protein [Portunus trituberculatus]